jgi:hypothetical protein
MSPQRRILETGISVHMNAFDRLACATYGRTNPYRVDNVIEFGLDYEAQH